MTISLSKALLGTLSVGAFGLGIYGVCSLAFSTPSKTVKQTLQEDSTITILDVEGSTSDSDWNTKVTEIENNTVDPVLEGYTKEESVDNKEKVKEICKKLLEEDSKKSSKLKQAKKWCTKPKTGAP